MIQLTRMAKYKYYFRKPKSEIVKDIILWLAVGGAVVLVASSPSFGASAARSFQKWLKKRKQYKNKKVYDAFYQLRKQGCVAFERKGHQIFIQLTTEGRKKAGRLQIDSLKISKPKKWDGKFRLVIFDIVQLKSFYRNAFRGKLQALGFLPLQKSVWIHPYPCKDEVDTLRDFFGLTTKEVCLVTVEQIENARSLKEKFQLT